jgi:hypothetical protein
MVTAHSLRTAYQHGRLIADCEFLVSRGHGPVALEAVDPALDGMPLAVVGLVALRWSTASGAASPITESATYASSSVSTRSTTTHTGRTDPSDNGLDRLTEPGPPTATDNTRIHRRDRLGRLIHEYAEVASGDTVSGTHRHEARLLGTSKAASALPSSLIEPLWNQFAALPQRPTYDPTHPLCCHRPRISNRTIFDKLPQLLLCQSWNSGSARSRGGTPTRGERGRRDPHEVAELGRHVGLVVVTRRRGDVRPPAGIGREHGANAVNACEVLGGQAGAVGEQGVQAALTDVQAGRGCGDGGADQ